MIEVDNLTKYYGPTRSIEDVTFSVEKGEVLGFLGPNGAGKSTTMRLLVGLSRPTAGSARIAGHDIQEGHDAIRKMIGYLPEQAPLYGDMTLGAYLRFMAGIKGVPKGQTRREMERTTELVNLEKDRKRLLRNLSKGTRQRAAIAQALLGDPQILILDEPTIGLDPSQINDIRNLVRSMRGERTVLLSTHILPEVEMICSRVVIISAGRIAVQGTPEELAQREDPQFHIVVRGERKKLEEILSKYGEARMEEQDNRLIATIPAPGEQQRPELARQLVEAGMELHEFHLARVRLEDVFLRSTARPAKE